MKCSEWLLARLGVFAVVLGMSTVAQAGDPKAKPQANDKIAKKKAPAKSPEGDPDKKFEDVEAELRELRTELDAAREGYRDTLKTAREKVRDAKDQDARKTAREEYRSVTRTESQKLRKIAERQRKLLTAKRDLLRKKYAGRIPRPKTRLPLSPEQKTVQKLYEKMTKTQKTWREAVRTRTEYLRDLKGKRGADGKAKFKEFDEAIQKARKAASQAQQEYRKALETQTKTRRNALKKKMP